MADVANAIFDQTPSACCQGPPRRAGLGTYTYHRVHSWQTRPGWRRLVREPTLHTPQRLQWTPVLGELGPVVGAALSVVPDLQDRGDVRAVVDVPVVCRGDSRRRTAGRRTASSGTGAPLPRRAPGRVLGVVGWRSNRDGEPSLRPSGGRGSDVHGAAHDGLPARCSQGGPG